MVILKTTILLTGFLLLMGSEVNVLTNHSLLLNNGWRPLKKIHQICRSVNIIHAYKILKPTHSINLERMFDICLCYNGALEKFRNENHHTLRYEKSLTYCIDDLRNFMEIYIVYGLHAFNNNEQLQKIGFIQIE